MTHAKAGDTPRVAPVPSPPGCAQPLDEELLHR